MSLERRPPSLPPEKRLEDKSSVAEKSLRSQYWDYAYEETGKQTVGLICGGIGALVSALIVGSFWGGVAAGVVAAVVTFLLTLAGIFSYYFLKAPYALNRIKERELALLKAGKVEREKHKLSLEVFTELYMTGPRLFEPRQSGMVMTPYMDWMCITTKDDPNVRYYNLLVHLRVRVLSNDEYESEIRKVTVHLVRKTARGKVKPIKTAQEGMSTQKENGPTGGDNLEGVRLTPGGKTEWYEYLPKYFIRAKYAKKFNSDCFLRVTMEYARQPQPFTYDLDIDWEEVWEIKRQVPFTPRS